MIFTDVRELYSQNPCNYKTRVAQLVLSRNESMFATPDASMPYHSPEYWQGINLANDENEVISSKIILGALWTEPVFKTCVASPVRGCVAGWVYLNESTFATLDAPESCLPQTTGKASGT